MTLDDARQKHPSLGLALYAFEPGSDVTLEVMSPDGTIFTFKGPTERAVLDAAFPEDGSPASEVEMPATERESAWAALRMVADCVGERFGPVADLESEEASLRRGPEYHHFAKGIVEALLRVPAPEAPAENVFD